MGFFKSWGKMVSYPLTRSYQDLKASASGISRSVQEAKEYRSRKIAEHNDAQTYLTGKTAREKFAEVFEINGWTEEELVTQKQAARNTRIGMVALALVGMLVLLALLAVVPTWIMFFMGPMAVVLFAGCGALAARYAWWEAQIEEREIHPFKSFLSREDFFTRVLKLKKS